MRFCHRFVKTKPFKAAISDLDAWDEIDDLKSILDIEPSSGKLIVGGDGLRKIRMPLPGKGKSGGARVIYYQIVDKKTIAFLFAYSKSDLDDLSPAQIKKVIRYRDETVRLLKEECDEKDN